MENGLEQLKEMIARDRIHRSVVVWSLCNELGGQHPPAHQFAKHMLEEAKSLDPNRLCSYASNSLIKTPERDAGGLMDIIEVNEYFGTWDALATFQFQFRLLHSAFANSVFRAGAGESEPTMAWLACISQRPCHEPAQARR